MDDGVQGISEVFVFLVTQVDPDGVGLEVAQVMPLLFNVTERQVLHGSEAGHRTVGTEDGGLGDGHVDDGLPVGEFCGVGLGEGDGMPGHLQDLGFDHGHIDLLGIGHVHHGAPGDMVAPLGGSEIRALERHQRGREEENGDAEHGAPCPARGRVAKREQNNVPQVRWPGA